MIDFITQYEAILRFSVFLSAFGFLALWEWANPKRELTQVKIKRWGNNLALVISSTVIVRVVVGSTAVGTAYLVEQNNWGFVNYIDMPFWLKVTVTFILLDLTIYFQHVMFHVLPVFWRFHRVHHSDLDCDVTTGLRFHPVEILISFMIKLVAIIALGAPVLAVILFEVILNLMSLFTHSNIYLNNKFESILRWVLTTPDMHRVHHSTKENETNSNFCFNFSLWDRVFSTYIAEPEKGYICMTIGLEQFREHKWQKFIRLLIMPFTIKIKGYAINYRDSKNEDELTLARTIADQSREKARIASELSSYMKAIDQHALVSVTDSKGTIIQVNDKFSEVSGYKYNELLYQDHKILNSGTHPKTFFMNLWTTIASGKSWRGEICNRSKNGDLYWVDTTIVPVFDVEGKIERYISIIMEITENKKQQMEIKKAYEELEEANKELEKISRTDGLTQIANRRYFDEALLKIICMLSRTGSSLSLIICDVDYFKNYNDTYGHPAGDVCLQQIAKSLSASFSRKGDLVARYGGEEFVVILPNVDKITSLKLAERMLKNLAKLKLEHNSSTVAKMVTISVGVTTLVPDKDTSATMIIEKADKALYLAKEKGRNNVQYF